MLAAVGAGDVDDLTLVGLPTDFPEREIRLEGAGKRTAALRRTGRVQGIYDGRGVLVDAFIGNEKIELIFRSDSFVENEKLAYNSRDPFGWQRSLLRWTRDVLSKCPCQELLVRLSGSPLPPWGR